MITGADELARRIDARPVQDLKQGATTAVRLGLPKTGKGFNKSCYEFVHSARGPVRQPRW